MSEHSESMAERKIREATERGAFENLPGAGKPLDLRGANDPNWWVSQFIEREGLDPLATAPTVLGLRREAQGFPDSLAHVADEGTVRAMLESYNARVKRDRLHPSLDLPIPILAPLVEVDAMVERWRKARSSREQPGSIDNDNQYR